jgi:hypothetical protein
MFSSQQHKRFYLLRYLLTVLTTLTLLYITACGLLFFRQRDLIYRPRSQFSMLPSASTFKLPYQDVWIPIPGFQDRLHGWWIPSPSLKETFIILPGEPASILKSPKTMLYFYGVGRNKGDYNYLARVAGFRQLGFSVLMVDYRGYGRSDGDRPSELQLYQDSQAAWSYLRYVRNTPPGQILIYGESLGGAIALDLAVKHPEAGGLIMQSSFTSMADVAKHSSVFRFFPIDLLLTERFDSLSKIKQLDIPVLFLHGAADSVVPSDMSQKLCEAAPECQQLFLISGADHVKIYKPGKESYLRGIQRFVQFLR